MACFIMAVIIIYWGGEGSQERFLRGIIWFHYTDLANLKLILLDYILFFGTICAVAIADWFKWESLILQAVISSFKRYSPIPFI